MTDTLRFDGQVAIVTVDGSGADARAADKVVAEIKAEGGEATPNYDSVENGANIVKTAMVRDEKEEGREGKKNLDGIYI
eukprot:evm.model.NODE_19184_length_12086_cov_51.707016.2